MPGFQVLCDPTAEATGTQLDISDNALGYWLMALDLENPEDAVQRAGSADTEGDLPASSRPQNRTITAVVRCAEPSGGSPSIRAIVADLQEKVGKYKREGGTLRVVYPDATTITFDVFKNGAHNIAAPTGVRWTRRRVAEVTITLECKFAGRGAEVELGSDTVETTLPVLIKTTTGITGPNGDADALGRLLIDNDDANRDMFHLLWGVEANRDYAFTDSTGSGALFYEAESRTLLGKSTSAAVAGASGGNVARSGPLSNAYWEAVLSTQASGGGAHLTHVGMFSVWARVKVSNTSVRLRLSWRVGRSQHFAHGPTLDFPAQDRWYFVKLADVAISKVDASHRWEGVLFAKSTTFGGYTCDADYLMLVPTGWGSGEAKAKVLFQSPTTYTAKDDFENSSAGPTALTGQTAQTGGTWAAWGDTDDFQVTQIGGGNEAARRTATSDTSNTGRRAYLPQSMTDAWLQVDVLGSSVALATELGLLARSDHVGGAWMAITLGDSSVNVTLYSGGSTVIGKSWTTLPFTRAANAWYTLAAYLDKHGRLYVWCGPQAGTMHFIGEWYDSRLATGGSHAAGNVGLYDQHGSASANTRDYDNFFAFVPIVDAAIYAGKPIEISSTRVKRTDPSNVVGQPTSYEGDYLNVPPAGAEGRSVRLIAKATANDPDVLDDDVIPDLSGRLFATPRYYIVPAV